MDPNFRGKHMFRNIFILSCAVLAIAGLPQYAQEISVLITDKSKSGTSEPKAFFASAPELQSRAHYATGARAASIPMDKAGHFSADFKINGRNVRGVIDTGATYVAVNMSTARNLGLNPKTSDFKHQVSTANGKTRAALVMLDRMDLGSISVEGVEAFVLDDTALSSTLIGMSFMSKLNSYRVKNQHLEMIN